MVRGIVGLEYLRALSLRLVNLGTLKPTIEPECRVQTDVVPSMTMRCFVGLPCMLLMELGKP